METFNIEVKQIAQICKDLNKLNLIKKAEYFSFRDIGHNLRIEFIHGTVCLYRGFNEINFIHNYFTQNGFT